MKLQFTGELTNSNLQVIDLITKETFTDIQKKIKCKVLLNYKSSMEMTLVELVAITKPSGGRKALTTFIPLQFSYEKIKSLNREIRILNEAEFQTFLSYIYYTYRKIEIRMENCGLKNLGPYDLSEKSFSDIGSTLKRAKKAYTSMNTNDFLHIYPILKILFYSYLHYIKYALDYLNVIDEGKVIPGRIEQFQTWLFQLNEWFVLQYNEKWRSFMEAVIFKSSKHDRIIEKLQRTSKFKTKEVLIEETLTEPLIGTLTNRRGCQFGFVDMSYCEKGIEPDLPMFELECPQGCSPHSRKWVCMKCGDFVKIKVDGNINGKLYLLCSCGKKSFNPRILKCHQCEEKGKSNGLDNPCPSTSYEDESIIRRLIQINPKPRVTPVEPQSMHSNSSPSFVGFQKDLKDALLYINNIKPSHPTPENPKNLSSCSSQAYSPQSHAMLSPNHVGTRIANSPFSPSNQETGNSTFPIPQAKPTLFNAINRPRPRKPLPLLPPKNIYNNLGLSQSSSNTSPLIPPPPIPRRNKPDPPPQEYQVPPQEYQVPPPQEYQVPPPQEYQVPPREVELRRTVSATSDKPKVSFRPAQINPSVSRHMSYGAQHSVTNTSSAEFRLNQNRISVSNIFGVNLRPVRQNPSVHESVPSVSEDQPDQSNFQPPISQQNNELRDLILNQFQKLHQRGNTDEKIIRAIKLISEKRSAYEIRIAIEDIQKNLTLTGDIADLIERYLYSK